VLSRKDLALGKLTVQSAKGPAHQHVWIIDGDGTGFCNSIKPEKFVARSVSRGTNPGSLRGGILPGCGEGRKNLRCRGAESALPTVCSRNANWNDDQACVVEVDVLVPRAKVLSVHSNQRAEQLAVCCVGAVQCCHLRFVRALRLHRLTSCVGPELIWSPAKEVFVALEHCSQFCYAEQLLQSLV
jgi:hypothetical protein